MSRSFSNVKVVSATIADGICNAIFRRGYAATQPGAKSSGVKGAASMLRKTKEESARPTEKVAWVPDPKTGYYRPENCTEEIDPAELRAMLLNNKN